MINFFVVFYFFLFLVRINSKVFVFNAEMCGVIVFVKDNEMIQCRNTHTCCREFSSGSYNKLGMSEPCCARTNDRNVGWYGIREHVHVYLNNIPLCPYKDNPIRSPGSGVVLPESQTCVLFPEFHGGFHVGYCLTI